MKRKVLLAALLSLCMYVMPALAGVTGAPITTGKTGSAGGLTVKNASNTTVWSATGSTALVTQTVTKTSQTTETNGYNLTLSTDSTFLTGTNMTYTSARGSNAIKLASTYSGLNGGFSNIDSKITNSGAHTEDGAGVIGIKQIVTNTAAMTDGNIYGGQFWAKHTHATSKMANAAPLIGLEGIAYVAGAAPAGTIIGGNFGYHNEGTTAKDGGAVYRGIQIVCDDASGSTAPSEASGLVIWNMAGTQTNGLYLVKSDSGFTYDVKLQNGETIDNATNGIIKLTGDLQATTISTKSETGATDTIESTDYGKTIFYSYAGAVAVTLPAAGAAAGSWFRCVNANSDTTAPTYSTPVADNLIAPNNATADSVTFGSASRIGSSVKFISNGSYWMVINESTGCTMTVTDAG